MDRRSLLYISPVVPAPSGRGLAMRAYHNLLALSSVYDVRLIIVPHNLARSPLNPILFNACRSVEYLPLSLGERMGVMLRLLHHKVARRLTPLSLAAPVDFAFATGHRKRMFAGPISQTRFDVIHVFRLYALPYALIIKEAGFSGTLELDLDESESGTRNSIRDLFRASNNASMARTLAQEARLYEAVERTMLSQADRLYVCSDAEKERLEASGLCRDVRTAPNIILRHLPHSHRREGPPFTFLIVGSYAYYPNLDGILFFCTDVLPGLRKGPGSGVSVRIIGGGIPRAVARRLSHISGVTLMGDVPDVLPYYAEAHAALVPIRAGGGTRIKILEAFACATPVVSTSKGAEGLAVEKDVHVLLGDTPADFAEQCLRLIREPGLSDRLRRNAQDLIRKRYALGNLIQSFTGNRE